jgi:hypothetical protein
VIRAVGAASGLLVCLAGLLAAQDSGERLLAEANAAYRSLGFPCSACSFS